MKKNNNNLIYDPFKREPEYCNAQHEKFWELILLQKHFHPSVVKFSEQLLSGKSIKYHSNPLNDFNLMNFLERFCYRNPKSKYKNQKRIMTENEMIPKKTVKLYEKRPPVNSENFF